MKIDNQREAKLALIVISGNKSLFGKWLKHYEEATHERRTRCVLIPWGSQSNDLVEMAKLYDIEIPPYEERVDTYTESNRNCALKYLSKYQPQFVGFLDDDTFINKTWLLSILQSITPSMNHDVLLSIVSNHISIDKSVKMAGHVIKKGRLSNLLYPICSDKVTPFGPCMNCAVVSWNLIQLINEITDGNWEICDPQFNNEPETCIDMSIKLTLVGAKATIVPNAFADHVDPKLQVPKDSYDAALSRLTRRFLLYFKYLEGSALSAALNTVERDKDIWRKRGFFVYSQLIKIDDVDSFIQIAGQKAQELANRKNVEYNEWRIKMSDSGLAYSIFDLPKTN